MDDWSNWQEEPEFKFVPKSFFGAGRAEGEKFFATGRAQSFGAEMSSVSHFLHHAEKDWHCIKIGLPPHKVNL